MRRSTLMGTAVCVFASLATPLILSAADAAPAGATTVTTLKQKAAAIATKVEVAKTKLDVLSEEYDQALSRQAQLLGEIAKDKSAMFAAKTSVKLDVSRLHKQAVDAYVNSGSAQGVSSVLSSNANALPLQQTYLGVVSGSLSTAETSLKVSEHALNVKTTSLEAAESQAAAATKAASSSQTAASALEGQLASTLQGVQGTLATAVSQQEAQQAAQQAASAAAAAAAATATTQSAGEGAGNTGIAGTSTSTSGSSPGAAAVAAAATQLGVPYRWAGATPGSGFDCSGLAMWAWGQAGVNLSHSAESQYNEIEHVSMSDLQPGDLIFYASGGYIYHVIMYAGNGRAIQAIDTGTVIQYTPVWPGAMGAGRP